MQKEAVSARGAEPSSPPADGAKNSRWRREVDATSRAIVKSEDERNDVESVSQGLGEEGEISGRRRRRRRSDSGWIAADSAGTDEKRDRRGRLRG